MARRLGRCRPWIASVRWAAMKPRVEYAPVDSVGASATYSVSGAGPQSIFVSNWISNLDAAFDADPWQPFLQGLQSFCTMLLFDQLGVGQSDAVSREQLADRGVWIATINAVLDNEQWPSASLIGWDFAALAQIAFAAMFPQRVDKLVLINPVACATGSETLAAVLSATVEETAQLMMSMWATPSYLRILSPSAADNAELCEEWARWQRSCLSPARAREVFKMVLSADVSELLTLIECPTLVIDTTIGTANVIQAQSVGLAEQIPRARLVKLRFGDHFPIRPADTRAVLADICEFLTGERPESPTRRALATICFTDIVDSTLRARALGDREWVETLTDHDQLVARIVSQHRGRVVKRTGDGVLAVFETPSEAIEACVAMRPALDRFDLQIRAGIHTGEVEVADDGDLHGVGVHVAARVAAEAAAGEILVSAALVSLTAGTDIFFDEPATRHLAGIGDWQVASVKGSR
jgi:class 3 adenylate cyclase